MNKDISPTSRHELNTIDFTTLFASNIHEIKNLLFMLISSLDETIDSSKGALQDDAEGRAKLSVLKYNGQRINDKLIQMLSLFSISQKRYQVNIAYHSVGEFLEDRVIEAQPLLNARSISITASCEDGLCWFFDKDIADGIISNAIHNALSYAKSQISIKAYTENGLLVIDVEDDGSGFAQDILDNGGSVQSLNISEGKTGLGLYFSAVSAKLHVNKDRAGFITLRNGNDLKGAVFSLHLP